MPGRTLAHLVILSAGEFRGCLLRESATRTTVVPFAGVGHCRRVSNCRRRRSWARFTASGVFPPALLLFRACQGHLNAGSGGWCLRPVLNAKPAAPLVGGGRRRQSATGSIVPVAEFDPKSAKVEPAGRAVVLSVIIGLAMMRWPCGERVEQSTVCCRVRRDSGCDYRSVGAIGRPPLCRTAKVR